MSDFDDDEYYDNGGFPFLGALAVTAILAVFALLVLSLNRQQSEINRQDALIDKALDGSGPSIVYFPAGVFIVDTDENGERAVTRRAAQISGRTCFRGTGPYLTDTTEIWRFTNGLAPTGFASTYPAPDVTIPYNGPNDRLQLNENSCFVFAGFQQAIPDGLLRDMDAMPCTPLSMYVSITAAATDLGSGRFTLPVPIQTDPFTIPPASDCTGET